MTSSVIGVVTVTSMAFFSFAGAAWLQPAARDKTRKAQAAAANRRPPDWLSDGALQGGGKKAVIVTLSGSDLGRSGLTGQSMSPLCQSALVCQSVTEKT